MLITNEASERFYAEHLSTLRYTISIFVKSLAE